MLQSFCCTFRFFCGAGLKSADTPRSPRRRKKGEDAVPLPDELLTSLVSERAELVEWAEAGFVGKLFGRGHDEV